MKGWKVKRERRKGKGEKGTVAVFSMFGQLVVCKEKSKRMERIGISMADSGQVSEGVHSERHVGSSVGRPSSMNQASTRRELWASRWCQGEGNERGALERCWRGRARVWSSGQLSVRGERARVLFDEG